jgi:hypothetical protein
MGNQENQRKSSYEVSHGSAGRSLEMGVLENIGIVTRAELRHDFRTDREFDDYLFVLRGLEITLDYIRNLGSSNIVVDVGTGEGKSWSWIKYRYGEGLEFWATGLVNYDCNEQFDGRFRNTSAEIMDGFETASVGGIIAVRSIAYGSPKPCIDRIDEILVPGGVIKSCFCSSDIDHLRNGYKYKTHHLFTERLQELNYNMVVSGGIVLAIKPGGLQKASDLMEKDLSYFSSHNKFIRS